jgi:DNA-directed RNA polymerase I subunit RPA1
VHADHQFIVPTDGKPIRGLIQDHVVAGVLLTKRDTWLQRPMYMQLVHFACNAWRPGAWPGAQATAHLPTCLRRDGGVLEGRGWAGLVAFL